MQFTYKNDINELRQLAKDLITFGGVEGVDSKVIFELNLCLDEVLTNVITYEFSGVENPFIEVSVEYVDGVIEAVVRDSGKAFNPLEHVKEPPIDLPLEERPVGGLGIFFLKKYTDSVAYNRIDGENHLSLVKKV